MQSLFRWILGAFSIVAAALIVLQVGIALWAQHGITEVEPVVAAHSYALASGEGVYYDLNRYPFTVSVYGPIFYLLSAVGITFGAPPLAVGRVISILAFLGVIWCVYRLLNRYCKDRYAIWAGTLATASTTNLVSWATVGQTDMLALFFSVAALERYSAYDLEQRRGALAASAALIACAIFTKQSFVAAGAAITLGLLVRDRRQGVRFAVGLGAAGAAAALGLNLVTGGDYWANAVLANLNPHDWRNFVNHLKHFGLTMSALAVVALAGIAGVRAPRGGRGTPHLFVLFAACSAVVFLATCGKIGSDLNYQIEIAVAVGLCAGLALDRLRCFPLLFANDKRWIVLLQAPLLFHLLLSCALTAKFALQRIPWEMACRERFAALAPVLENSPRILSEETDSLVQLGRSIEVEPFIYDLLVTAGLTDPRPVLEDLRARNFDAVVLYERLHGPGSESPTAAATLPPDHLKAIKTGYRLLDEVPGPPRGRLFLYVPRREPEERTFQAR